MPVKTIKKKKKKKIETKNTLPTPFLVDLRGCNPATLSPCELPVRMQVCIQVYVCKYVCNEKITRSIEWSQPLPLSLLFYPPTIL